jgi:hypothetical protein
VEHYREWATRTVAIRFADVDRKFGSPPGSAEKHLGTAAKRWEYVVARKGKTTIMFKGRPLSSPFLSSPMGRVRLFP